jgi:hypothetical protein
MSFVDYRPEETNVMDATKKKLAVGAVAVAALAGGGAAVAAGGLGSSEDQQAIIDDAAKKLGVPELYVPPAKKKDDAKAQEKE